MWVDPIYYAYQALACNEFLSPGPNNLYSTPVPDRAGLTVGEAILQQRGLATEEAWVWVGPLVNLALGAGYLLLTWVAMSRLEWTDPVNIVEGEIEVEGEVEGEEGSVGDEGGKEVKKALAATPLREEKEGSGSGSGSGIGVVGVLPAGLQHLLSPLWLLLHPTAAPAAEGQQHQGGGRQQAASSATATTTAAALAPSEWVRTPATEGEEYDDEEEETKEERGAVSTPSPTPAAAAAAVMEVVGNGSPALSVASASTRSSGVEEDLELGFPSGAVAAAAIEAALPTPTPPSLSYCRRSETATAVASYVTSSVGSRGVARSRSNSGGTSALAVEPLTLTFEDVCYSVTLRKKRAPAPEQRRRRRWVRAQGEATETVDLLQGITGYVAPGTMMALMGASGAGKTTLLDVRWLLLMLLVWLVCGRVGGRRGRVRVGLIDGA
jgi:hypothetical protein